ncbi:MAG: hypothetical protein ACRYFW_14350 [Janthinobacterium lividum]
MSQGEIERDLSRNLQEQVGAVIERHIKVAQVVLGPAELGLMLIQVAVSVTLTAAATTAASCDESKLGDVFDMAIASINALAAGDRDRSLSKIRTRLAAEAS